MQKHSIEFLSSLKRESTALVISLTWPQFQVETAVVNLLFTKLIKLTYLLRVRVQITVWSSEKVKETSSLTKWKTGELRHSWFFNLPFVPCSEPQENPVMAKISCVFNMHDTHTLGIRRCIHFPLTTNHHHTCGHFPFSQENSPIVCRASPFCAHSLCRTFLLSPFLTSSDVDNINPSAE